MNTRRLLLLITGILLVIGTISGSAFAGGSYDEESLAITLAVNPTTVTVGGHPVTSGTLTSDGVGVGATTVQVKGYGNGTCTGDSVPKSAVTDTNGNYSIQWTLAVVGAFSFRATATVWDTTATSSCVAANATATPAAGPNRTFLCVSHGFNPISPEIPEAVKNINSGYYNPAAFIPSAIPGHVDGGTNIPGNRHLVCNATGTPTGFYTDTSGDNFTPAVYLLAAAEAKSQGSPLTFNYYPIVNQ